MSDTFFQLDGKQAVATEWTRGPWSREHMHGGPPAALLLRALEEALGQGGVARFDVEFLKPLPIAAYEVDVEITRIGRKAQGAVATLAQKGVPMARARALTIRRTSLELPAPRHQPPAPPPPEACAPYVFTFFTDPIAYHAAMEMRVVRGTWGEGALMAWMRLRIGVVPGEEPSPAQRVVAGADSGNGLSAALDPQRYTFINPELTVYLHRQPVDDWICYEAVTVPQPTGIGLSECALYDRTGGIGRSLQSLVIEARP